MSTTPLLSESMLEELEARWRDQGALIVDALQPGLGPAEREALMAPLGLTLSIETELWWSWHDGTASSLTSHAIGLDLIALRLDAAVALFRQQVSDAAYVAEGADVAIGDVWPSSWFPIAVRGDGTIMTCDCSAADGQPTPIGSVNWHKRQAASVVPVAQSLGTVVHWWIDALDRGAWTYNREGRRWESHPERLADPALTRTGLV